MQDRLLAARGSVVLLIVGPIVAIAGVVIARSDSVALGAIAVGAAIELLALVLGVMGVQHLPGKIGLLGSLVMLVVFGMVLPLVMFRSVLN